MADMPRRVFSVYSGVILHPRVCDTLYSGAMECVIHRHMGVHCRAYSGMKPWTTCRSEFIFYSGVRLHSGIYTALYSGAMGCVIHCHVRVQYNILKHWQTCWRVFTIYSGVHRQLPPECLLHPKII